MGTVSNEEKKRFLWGYRDSVRRIKRIESEIEELRTMRMSASTGRGGGASKGWKNDLSSYAASLDSLERGLERERGVRVQAYRDVEAAINSLEDTREQDVLFYRYIKGLAWWEIAERVDYSERQVHRFHGRALAHMDILKDVIECQC